MSNGIIGKILYFWVFILGGLFFAKVLGFAKDDRSTIILCVAIAVVYIVFQVGRAKGKKKTAAKAEANKPVVRKGQASNKHKKKR